MKTIEKLSMNLERFRTVEGKALKQPDRAYLLAILYGATRTIEQDAEKERSNDALVAWLTQRERELESSIAIMSNKTRAAKGELEVIKELLQDAKGEE